MLRCISDAVAESVENSPEMEVLCLALFGFYLFVFWGVVVFVFRVFVVLGICFLGMCGVGFFLYCFGAPLPHFQLQFWAASRSF